MLLKMWSFNPSWFSACGWSPIKFGKKFLRHPNYSGAKFTLSFSTMWTTAPQPEIASLSIAFITACTVNNETCWSDLKEKGALLKCGSGTIIKVIDMQEDL